MLWPSEDEVVSVVGARLHEFMYSEVDKIDNKATGTSTSKECPAVGELHRAVCDGLVHRPNNDLATVATCTIHTVTIRLRVVVLVYTVVIHGAQSLPRIPPSSGLFSRLTTNSSSSFATLQHWTIPWPAMR